MTPMSTEEGEGEGVSDQRNGFCVRVYFFLTESFLLHEYYERTPAAVQTLWLANALPDIY